MPPKLPLSRLSFRLQVLLLGGLVAVLFLAVLFAAFAAFRYTKSSVLSEEKERLLETTRDLAHEYSNKADFARGNKEVPPLENSSLEASNEALALLSSVVLQNAEGIEGGFYARSPDTLVGYSFPTRGGADSADEDIVRTDRLAVVEIARQAVLTREPSERVLVTARDIVLIEAVPIPDSQSFPGSAWTLKRLP